jgi:alpha,alpha-trehalase
MLIVRRFGWVNASYVYGLEILNAHMRRSLGAITPYDTYHKAVVAQDAF